MDDGEKCAGIAERRSSPSKVMPAESSKSGECPDTVMEFDQMFLRSANAMLNGWMKGNMRGHSGENIEPFRVVDDARGVLKRMGLAFASASRGSISTARVFC